MEQHPDLILSTTFKNEVRQVEQHPANQFLVFVCAHGSDSFAGQPICFCSIIGGLSGRKSLLSADFPSAGGDLSGVPKRSRGGK